MSIDPLNIGASGMEAYETQADVAANDVANVLTPGFQGQDVNFQDIYNGVRVGAITTNPAPGGFTPAAGPTNLAINGLGFFMLQGAPGGPIYTRDGSFSVGANGQLVASASGLAVASTSGTPITIPAGVTNLSIGADGTVSGVLANGQSASFGQIGLATFANNGGLTRVSGGFQGSPASGAAQVGAPGSAGYGSLLGAGLNSSNVDLGSEMITMIAAQVAFEANAKTVHTGDQMLKTVINLPEEKKG